MRPSLKSGPATGQAGPQPVADPVTKVVLPAPGFPFRRTRSPDRSRRPRSSPAASVSSGDEVSSEMVVATGLELKITTVRADDPNRRLGRHHSDRAHARIDDLLPRPAPNQLPLPPT